ncbi:hypothetical protein HDU98_001144 [Podochytrium sp. JEL0797]|nr:hypothetical protein HDU98_001144 [Podochytrium sp. JEL0797]
MQFKPQIAPFAINDIAPHTDPSGEKKPYDIGPSLFPVSKEIPTYLSKRFTRAKKPKSISGPTVDADANSGSSVGEKTGTPSTPGGMKKTGGVSAVGIGGMMGISDSPAAQGKGRKDSNDDQEAAPAAMNPDESYSPFHLADKSSFNSARLNARQLKRMDTLTRAKYLAYEKPPAEIIQNIDDSSVRAKMWHKQEHKKLMQQCDNIRTLMARKKGHVGAEEEAIAQDNAQKATDRMKEKFKNMTLARETELAFLVEGQPNAIDAIRLKEYLSNKAKPIRLSKSYTDRDRLRVEELLSIRGQT